MGCQSSKVIQVCLPIIFDEVDDTDSRYSSTDSLSDRKLPINLNSYTEEDDEVMYITTINNKVQVLKRKQVGPIQNRGQGQRVLKTFHSGTNSLNFRKKISFVQPQDLDLEFTKAETPIGFPQIQIIQSSNDDDENTSIKQNQEDIYLEISPRTFFSTTDSNNSFTEDLFDETEIDKIIKEEMILMKVKTQRF
ncbi:UNKNOWN [Stylonychia lemnae]|uniref:Uncharacterized protein n=1 Tax=Stylonychia lemnae TaxID=5949 RepID=A0A078A0Q6_STYLE|nr:UNKNOWN [Stylonychia lemnae]|eukprot:CDW75720.1 UNKNOWN [Stylonychia lemnae]